MADNHLVLNPHESQLNNTGSKLQAIKGDQSAKFAVC